MNKLSTEFSSNHPRFICDAMLGDLGRWLRVSGYDTEIITGSTSDKEIFHQAIVQRRILLTRDKEFLERKGAQRFVLVLHTKFLEEHVVFLNLKLNLNWLNAPLSRCLNCNIELEQAPTENIKKLKLEIQKEFVKFLFCPECHKVYWEGGHAQRMKKRLQGWEDLKTGYVST